MKSIIRDYAVYWKVIWEWIWTHFGKFGLVWDGSAASLVCCSPFHSCCQQASPCMFLWNSLWFEFQFPHSNLWTFAAKFGFSSWYFVSKIVQILLNILSKNTKLTKHRIYICSIFEIVTEFEFLKAPLCTYCDLSSHDQNNLVISGRLVFAYIWPKVFAEES